VKKQVLKRTFQNQSDLQRPSHYNPALRFSTISQGEEMFMPAPQLLGWIT